MAEQENNNQEIPAWAKELMEATKALHEAVTELKQEKKNSFSMSQAVRDWIAEKDQAKDPGEQMDALYKRRNATDDRGWPIARPEREIPPALLERVAEIAASKRKAIHSLMGGDDQA